MSDPIGKALPWVAGGFIVWSLLPPETKRTIKSWLVGLNRELQQAQLRQAQQALPVPPPPFRLAQLPASPEPGATLPPALDLSDLFPALKSALSPLPLVEPDNRLRQVITHPSVILVLGKRGSGKSALAYRLLELFRYGPRPYVIGVPNLARKLLPDWIGIAASLEEVPTRSIALVDEAYLAYHASVLSRKQLYIWRSCPGSLEWKHATRTAWGPHWPLPGTPQWRRSTRGHCRSSPAGPASR